MLCLSGFELYSRWVPLYLSTAVINTTEIIFNKLTELGEIILHSEWLMLKKSLEKTAIFILHKAKISRNGRQLWFRCTIEQTL